MAGEASALRRYLPEIRAFLEPCSEPWAPCLVGYLERSLDAADGRARHAQALRSERSEVIRSAIRAELNRFAIERPRLNPRELTIMVRRALAVRLDKYGLRRTPGARTIRDEIVAAQKANGRFSSQ